MPSPEQIAKLPKWAQRHIRVLEIDLSVARGRLAAAPDSDTYASPYRNPPEPLGANTTIRLLLGGDLVTAERNYIDVRRDIDHKGRAYVYVNASDLLVVEPQASNTVRLRVERL